MCHERESHKDSPALSPSTLGKEVEAPESDLVGAIILMDSAYSLIRIFIAKTSTKARGEDHPTLSNPE